LKPPNDPNGGFIYLVFDMKAMSKQELADCAGVSVKTLMNWCRPFRQELAALGMNPHAKKLPPHIIHFLTEKFCIDI
jgi:hypothetical protein